MTMIERQLAATFRAARWRDSGGQAVCPDCFEGDALVVDQPPRLSQPGLASYRCRDCNQRFSDLSGTPLRGSPASLRDWALALWTVDRAPLRLKGRGYAMRWEEALLGPPRRRLVLMRARWLGAETLRAAWAERLRAQGLTLPRLCYGTTPPEAA